MIFFQNIFGPEMADALDAARPNDCNALTSGTGESGTPDTIPITAIPYVGDVTVSGNQTRREITGTTYLNDSEVPFSWTISGVRLINSSGRGTR
jgi:hypothetical protein